jgi:ubiquinone/menaquinone biosynthesis C-methylase UbiE
MIRIHKENPNNIENWNRQWIRKSRKIKKSSQVHIEGSEERFRYFGSKINVGNIILDLACGFSEFTQIMKKEKGVKAYGMDFSGYAMQRMKKLVPGVNWVIGDVLQIPFRTRKFDVVIAGETIEHFEKPGLLIAEMERVTKIGGRMVLSTPHIYGYKYHLWVFKEDDLMKLMKPFGDVEIRRVPDHYIVACCTIKKS